MKRDTGKKLFSGILLVGALAGGLAMDARGQAQTAEAHVAAAKAAAAPKTANPKPWQMLDYAMRNNCAPPRAGAANEESEATGSNVPLEKGEAAKLVPTPFEKWYYPPAKVFDNLYYVGTKTESTWAVTTSDGIILLNVNFDWVTIPLLQELRMVGLDPANIKYAVITHAHSDQAWGINNLKKVVPGVHVIMSQGDWDTLANDNTPARLKPEKDMVATDGQKLTLGDTTLTLFITPGSSPGTMSVLVPLKDGNERHMGSMIGGTTMNVVRGGLKYYPDAQTQSRTYMESNKRFKEAEDKAGADVVVSIHAALDKTFEKIDALRSRKAGEPNPFVDKDVVDRFSTILIECSAAKLAWASGN